MATGNGATWSAGQRDSMAKVDPIVDFNSATVGAQRNGSIFTQRLTTGFEPKYRESVKSKKSRPSLEEDPWAIKELASTTVPWKDLTPKEKFKRVGSGIFKVVAVLFLLYFFVCSLECLSLGFRLVGGRTTGEIFQNSMMIGILTTVLVQSSSTSTSIIVSMVSAGFMEVKMAIPIVMGANIGTSVTNTIVSLTQAGDRNQFRRAFAGATVHDMFNWLSVITLLIVEVTTGYLYHLTSWVTKGLPDEPTEGEEIKLLTVITDPFIDMIVQLNSSVMECWANENCRDADEASLLKDGDSLFAKIGWSDVISGVVLLLASLLILCGCLILIVKVLQSVMQGQIANVIKKTLNAKIPYVPWITGYIALGIGALFTFLVQSSSVFTSALTPLVGLGVISVERVYPLTLGSNIGTTTTALLAALAVEGKKFKPSLQIALVHLFFNISGIILFYPIPFMRFPVEMAKFLGETTAKYRWFAFAYMFLMFILLPGVTMGLSLAGAPYVIAFASIICFIFLFVVTINLVRAKKPSWLPGILNDWKFLPLPLRSLEPYDKFFTQWACCKKLQSKNTDHDNPVFDIEIGESGTYHKTDNLKIHPLDDPKNGRINPAFTE